MILRTQFFFHQFFFPGRTDTGTKTSLNIRLVFFPVSLSGKLKQIMSGSFHGSSVSGLFPHRIVIPLCLHVGSMHLADRMKCRQQFLQKIRPPLFFYRLRFIRKIFPQDHFHPGDDLFDLHISGKRQFLKQFFHSSG